MSDDNADKGSRNASGDGSPDKKREKNSADALHEVNRKHDKADKALAGHLIRVQRSHITAARKPDIDV